MTLTRGPGLSAGRERGASERADAALVSWAKAWEQESGRWGDLGCARETGRRDGLEWGVRHGPKGKGWPACWAGLLSGLGWFVGFWAGFLSIYFSFLFILF